MSVNNKVAPQQNEEITREEIKKEFQLERMILFSDAVFAIVITLMAIEIRLPEGEHFKAEKISEALFHLVPTILSYIVSFIFIGAIWFQHLKIFGLLKDYDKGLVVHNLLLLFFVGLFPFSATLITRSKGSMIAFFLYLMIILLCIFAQYLLYRHILKKPALRINADLTEHIAELHKRKVALIGFFATAVLVAATYIMIPQQEMKPMATLWMMLFPIVFKVWGKKKTVKKK